MKNIYVLDNEDELTNNLTEAFKIDSGIKIVKVLLKDYQDIMKMPPDIIVINEDVIKNETKTIQYCKEIRGSEDNSITPIVIVSSNSNEEHIIEILKNEVELYLTKPVNNEIMYYSIKNIMRLLNSSRMVSPLTGLPGNIQIQAEMKQRLIEGEEFVMLYIDLDNFKAYNDTYGFSNGDEIIKFTARIIIENVQKNMNSKNFVGHIGGDDFVAIVSENSDYEKICQDIIAEFDSRVHKYFTKEDNERGYIEVENRKGLLEQFPLTSISIGAVEVTKDRFKNTLEIGEVGAQVKHLAKTIYGSTYVIDRRINRDKKFDHTEKIEEN